MALSKAIRSPHLFVIKASGTDELATTNAVLTEVNSNSTSTQWKVKEVLFSRDDTGAVDLSLKLKERDTGNVFILKEILGFTTSDARIAANLADGEYYVDSDAEILVETSGIGNTENWNLRITGQVVG